MTTRHEARSPGETAAKSRASIFPSCAGSAPGRAEHAARRKRRRFIAMFMF
jgi:hypothetical protein